MIDRDILLRALAANAARHAEIARELEDPEVVADHHRVRELSRALGQLSAFARLHAVVLETRAALDEARELVAGDDAELRELAQAEIRAGVGGDEAALFAGDLFGMYGHFCQAHRLKIEVLDQNAGEMGGYKELVAQVSGAGAYRLLKFESGGHRVQRVPKTESQGRIHTSAATVAVLPKAEEVDVHIDWDQDVREDKMRAGGPGGQKVNKTESAIRLTHLETGLTVHCQDEKSQHKNRARARSILAARVFDHFQRKAHAERAAQRKGMIGSGDRSQRIRTYNFPQNRVTDHRLGFSSHDLEGVLLGSLDEFHQRLRLAEREERLRELAKELEAGGDA
jgi:peptide chain release factor 1